MPETPIEVVRLRQEIAYGYDKPKVIADLSIEPEYLDLGALIVKRVAALYAEALDIEMPESPKSVQTRNGLELLVDEATEKIISGEPHIILAKTSDKTLEFLAVNNRHLVAAAYGAEYDMWHVACVVGHETAITYAAEAVKPGTGIRTSFTLKGYTQLAATVGHKISSDALKADGQEFTYKITGKVGVERRNISSIFDSNFGTPLWRRYQDRFDF